MKKFFLVIPLCLIAFFVMGQEYHLDQKTTFYLRDLRSINQSEALRVKKTFDKNGEIAFKSTLTPHFFRCKSVLITLNLYSPADSKQKMLEWKKFLNKYQSTSISKSIGNGEVLITKLNLKGYFKISINLSDYSANKSIVGELLYMPENSAVAEALVDELVKSIKFK